MLRKLFFMSSSVFIRLLTGLVLFVFLARLLGVSQFGLFMYWFTITSLIGIVVDYGFSQQILRDIGQNPDRVKEIINKIIAAKLVLSAIVIIGTLVTTPFINAPFENVLLMWALLISVLLNSFAETFNAAFRGIGHFHEETYVVSQSNIVQFFIVLLLAWLGHDLVIIGIGYVLARLFFLYQSQRAYCLLTHDTVRPTFISVQNTLKNGFTFAAEAGVTNFQSQVDTLVVGFLLGPAAVGLYQAGLRLMQGANTFAQVLNNVYVPSMAGKFDQRPELVRLTSSLYTKMTLIGIVGALAFIFGGDWFVHHIYGKNYVDLTPLMPNFGILLMLRYMAGIHGVSLSASGLQSVRVYSVVLALIIMLISAFLLIPEYGLQGMLLASIISISALQIAYSLSLLFNRIPLGINIKNGVMLFIVIIGTAAAIRI